MMMTRTMMMSNSNSSSEKIRLELDQLHSEALQTRSKANSVRLRLMRLSEAAEKLRRQATISVQNGREDNARELLYQKKKVLEALDKSKARIQLLDELSYKLNEAISANEARLIDNVASDLDSVADDASRTVRIVSPTVEDANLNVDEISVQSTLEFTENQEMQTHENQLDQTVYTSANNITDDIAGLLQKASDVNSSLESTTTTSFDDFIANIDQQLNKIERELNTVLTVSNLVLGGDEKLNNLKVKQTLEILEGVRLIRERISKIMHSKMANGPSLILCLVFLMASI